jgi:signal transduction histidine kinase
VISNPTARRLAGDDMTMRDMWMRNEPRHTDGRPIPLEESPTMRALRGEYVRGVRLQLGTAAHSRIVEVSAAPLRDAEGNVIGVVSVGHDVTEQEQASRRLERLVEDRTRQLTLLQERRAREQRLAAVGQLAAGVMHDVNNLLNPIMAAAYLLQRHPDDPELVRRHAGRIAQAADTGAALTERLARFIRQEPLDASVEAPVDLAEVCREAVSLAEPLHGADGHPVVLECECEPGTAIVRGTATDLRAALLNLIRNAGDASRGGGRVRVTVQPAAGDAVVAVQDEGAGMTADTLERAFEPFFTTKGNRGTGLGLSEVYGVVRRHRGRVEIESEPGKGTTVRIVLPRDTGAR